MTLFSTLILILSTFLLLKIDRHDASPLKEFIREAKMIFDEDAPKETPEKTFSRLETASELARSLKDISPVVEYFRDITLFLTLDGCEEASLLALKRATEVFYGSSSNISEYLRFKRDEIIESCQEHFFQALGKTDLDFEASAEYISLQNFMHDRIRDLKFVLESPERLDTMIRVYIYKSSTSARSSAAKEMRYSVERMTDIQENICGDGYPRELVKSMFLFSQIYKPELWIDRVIAGERYRRLKRILLCNSVSSQFHQMAYLLYLKANFNIDQLDKQLHSFDDSIFTASQIRHIIQLITDYPRFRGLLDERSIQASFYLIPNEPECSLEEATKIAEHWSNIKEKNRRSRLATYYYLYMNGYIEICSKKLWSDVEYQNRGIPIEVLFELYKRLSNLYSDNISAMMSIYKPIDEQLLIKAVAGFLISKNQSLILSLRDKLGDLKVINDILESSLMNPICSLVIYQVGEPYEKLIKFYDLFKGEPNLLRSIPYLPRSPFWALSYQACKALSTVDVDDPEDSTLTGLSASIANEIKG